MTITAYISTLDFNKHDMVRLSTGMTLHQGTSKPVSRKPGRLLPALLAISTAIGSGIAGCSEEKPRVVRTHCSGITGCSEGESRAALTHQPHDIGLPKEPDAPPEVPFPEDFPLADFYRRIQTDVTKTPEWFKKEFQRTAAALSRHVEDPDEFPEGRLEDEEKMTFSFRYQDGQWDYIVKGYPLHFKDHKKQKIELLAVWNHPNKIDIAQRYMEMEKSSDGSLRVREFSRFNHKTKKHDLGGWSVQFPSRKEVKGMKGACAREMKGVEKVTNNVLVVLEDCLDFKIRDYNDTHDNRQVLPNEARDLAKLFFGWEQPEWSHLERVDDPDDR